MCWEFLVTASISLVVIGLFRLSASSSFSFGRLYVHFAQVVQFLGMELFIVISYNPLSFCGISCNFSFISDFVYLGPLSLFLMSLVKGLPILLIFSKNQFLYLLIL